MFVPYEKIILDIDISKAEMSERLFRNTIRQHEKFLYKPNIEDSYWIGVFDDNKFKITHVQNNKRGFWVIGKITPIGTGCRLTCESKIQKAEIIILALSSILAILGSYYLGGYIFFFLPLILYAGITFFIKNAGIETRKFLEQLANNSRKD